MSLRPVTEYGMQGARWRNASIRAASAALLLFSGGMSEQLERQHEAVWSAIDEIAAQCQMSASRLAIVSGFDATTFNKSKRALGDKRRWPSMEVIASVLQTAGMSYAEFGALVDRNVGQRDPS
jgi:hypothetical protein